MTNERCIEDLKSIKDYFIDMSGGSYPACIDHAITELEKIISKEQEETT